MPPTSHASTDELCDAIGVVHQGNVRDARIVSLVPSLTELLFALDLGGQVVGRTGFCIHPEAGVAQVTKVGGTKDVNLARIRGLKPSHVIVNIDENRRETVEALRQFVPHIVVTHPVTVRDNLALYRLFGALFDRRRQAAALCTALELALQQAGTSPIRARRVVYLIWKDPWMSVAANTYIADMLRIAGMLQVTVDDVARYPSIDLPKIAKEVDAILLSSEPYRFTNDDALALGRELGVPSLLVDGEQMSWYGSRAIDGVPYAFGVRARLDETLNA